MRQKETKRCPWAKTELEIAYHDKEWGKPLHDDPLLFEMLILEGMQAGLSWSTILNKRDYMRKVFDGFDPRKIADYTDEKLEQLMQDPGIIRNRLKLKAMVNNARHFLRLQEQHGSFDSYIWSFVHHQPIVNVWKEHGEVPATDEYSDQMSKALKKEGFKFVGSTICYAYMQATGMVNDHLVWCDEYNKSQGREG